MVTHSPSLTASSQSTVLLVLSPTIPAQSDKLDQLLKKIQAVLDSTVRTIQVSEQTHPEVVHSFNFESLPALALLQQGQEVWHYTGTIDKPDIFNQLYNQIPEAFLKTLPVTTYEPDDSTPFS
jgi:thioredoxin-like negative regulator of GroEL